MNEKIEQASDGVASVLNDELDTDDMTEISLGMSNFDMSVDEWFEDALRKDEGKVFGRHAGWNFNGKVYFSNGLFYEEVWRYGRIIETFSSENLKELMIDVCENYGYE